MALARNVARDHVAVDGIVPDAGARGAARAALRRRLLRAADIDLGIAPDRGPDDLRDVRPEEIDVALPETAPQLQPRNRALPRLEVQHVDGIRGEEAARQEVPVAVLMRLPDAQKARRALGESVQPALDRPGGRLDAGPDRRTFVLRQHEKATVGVNPERDVRRVLTSFVLQRLEQVVPGLESARGQIEAVAGAAIDVIRDIAQLHRRSVVEALADYQQHREERHDGDDGGAQHRRRTCRTTRMDAFMIRRPDGMRCGGLNGFGEHGPSLLTGSRGCPRIPGKLRPLRESAERRGLGHLSTFGG